MKRLLLLLVLAFAFSPVAVRAQKVSDSEKDPRTTQAYSLLIQRKVKVQAELENLLSEFSSEYPSAKRLDFELDTLKSEMKKMLEVDESKLSRLTPGYGGLVLRRVALATDVHMLLEAEGPEWPTVKEKQRELDLLDKEIQKVMR